MHFDDLREFIAAAQQFGEVETIKGADPNLEIGALYALNGEKPNPKLFLFDEIKGFKKGYRIATNTLAGRKRGLLSLSLPVDMSRADQAVEVKRRLREMKLVPPEFVSSSPLLDNIMEGNEVDVTKFPAPKWHELDVGPYIGTASAVLQRDPDTGYINIGSYRSQVFDRNHVGLHQAHGHHGQIIRDKYFEKGLDCPVVISLGEEPSLLAASGQNLPYGVSELEYAGGFRGAACKVLKGKYTPIPIPAGSEMVLEGFIMHPDHEPMRVEGPFGEGGGHYSHALPGPVVRVDAIYHRDDPIIMGQPPYKRVGGGGEGGGGGFPEIMLGLESVGLHHDIRGIAHAGPFMVVSVKQRYAGHALRIADYIMSGIANRPPRMLALVDEDVDPYDPKEVFWAISNRTDPQDSVHIYRNRWVSATSSRPPPEKVHAPLEHGYTLSTMVLDACKPFAWIDEYPAVNDLSPQLRKKTLEKWGTLLGMASEEGQKLEAPPGVRRSSESSM